MQLSIMRTFIIWKHGQHVWFVCFYHCSALFASNILLSHLHLSEIGSVLLAIITYVKSTVREFRIIISMIRSSHFVTRMQQDSFNVMLKPFKNWRVINKWIFSWSRKSMFKTVLGDNIDLQIVCAQLSRILLIPPAFMCTAVVITCW